MAWPASFLERLERRLASLDGPLIQVWSHDGSGARLLLDALRPRVHEIAPAVLSQVEVFEHELAQARASGKWLLVTGVPSLSIDPALARLTSDMRLLLFTHHRLTLDLLPSGGSSLLTPDDFRLTPREVAEYWVAARGEQLSPSVATALTEATEGWWAILQRVAESPLEISPSGPLDVAVIQSLPEVVAFRDATLSTPVTTPATTPVSTPLSTGKAKPVSTGEQMGAAPLVHPASPDQADFRIHLFGHPSLQRREIDATSGAVIYRDIDFTLRRCFKLVLYLAAAPDHRVGKEELIEVLWSDEDAASVQRNFHPTLSHLRRDLIGDCFEPANGETKAIVFRNRMYQLNPELRWWIDVDAFERQALEFGRRLEAGDVEAAVEVGRRAWRLYRGPFLDGQYDAWTHARRDDLQRTHLRLLRQLGDAWLHLDRPAEALDAYRAVITEDPLEESVQVAILRLYARQGRRDLVRRQYDKLCMLLLEELGVEPLPETTAEYHRLMA